MQIHYFINTTYFCDVSCFMYVTPIISGEVLTNDQCNNCFTIVIFSVLSDKSKTLGDVSFVKESLSTLCQISSFCVDIFTPFSPNLVTG